MRVWVISRRGVPSPFTAVTFLEGGRARGILVSPSGVRGLQEEEALRYLELSKRGERAFPDFIPALDRAEGLEVEDKAGEELRSLLEELEGTRETEARILALVESILRGGKRVEYLKVHTPSRNPAFERRLQESLGPAGPERWFWSRKFESYVFHPDLEGKAEEVLRQVFKGKHLLRRGKIWTVLDSPFQDSQPL